MNKITLAGCLLAAFVARLHGQNFHAEAADNASRPTPNASPNLIVRSDALAKSIVFDSITVGANSCQQIEYGIAPGTHKVLRFTVSTPNAGSGDLPIGDPNVHYQNNDGLFEVSACHGHFHFRHYATYELVDAFGNVWSSAKRGFCMIDVEPYQKPGKKRFTSCGTVGTPGNQGITAGWADAYSYALDGQYFVLDGGDGQTPVPLGNYKIRITVNPGFLPSKNEPCGGAIAGFPGPYRDSAGFCHQLPESNYFDNVAEVPVTIS